MPHVLPFHETVLRRCQFEGLCGEWHDARIDAALDCNDPHKIWLALISVRRDPQTRTWIREDLDRAIEEVNQL